MFIYILLNIHKAEESLEKPVERNEIHLYAIILLFKVKCILCSTCNFLCIQDSEQTIYDGTLRRPNGCKDVDTKLVTLYSRYNLIESLHTLRNILFLAAFLKCMLIIRL
jgi:hypothetical protein